MYPNTTSYFPKFIYLVVVHVRIVYKRKINAKYTPTEIPRDPLPPPLIREWRSPLREGERSHSPWGAACSGASPSWCRSAAACAPRRTRRAGPGSRVYVMWAIVYAM